MKTDSKPQESPTIAAMRKRHKSRSKYIKKRERQSRWVWADIHKSTHDDLGSALDRLKAAEATIKAIGELLEKWGRVASIHREASNIEFIHDCIAGLQALLDNHNG